MIVKKIICLMKGHVRMSGNEKDMFGYQYVYQKEFCQRCGKRIK